MVSPRVLLADDHRRVADAVGECVAEAFPLVGTVRDASTDLLEAIRAVADGGTYVSSAIAGS